jgi:esterase/lipase superfamily enzyme
VKREYHKWFSPYLQRDMELLIFGQAGKIVLFFPTRTARFYDYEDWHVIGGLEKKIEENSLQVVCLDSVDSESFYSKTLPPEKKIKRHLQFEKYILFEVIPFIKQKNSNPYLIAAGCSLGAFHAANITFRHPHLFKKLVGLSGRYDLTLKLEFFDDLFDGYRDENIYFNTPSLFMAEASGERLLRMLKRIEMIFVIGREDAFLENNILLNNLLLKKGINRSLVFWDGEAHKARYWKKMVQLYF